MPYLGRRVGPLLFWVLVALFCVAEGHRDLGRTASGAFLLGGGVLSAPSGPFFSHARFVPAPGLFPPQVFFPLPSRPASQWIARRYVRLLMERRIPRAAPRIPRRTPRLPNSVSGLVFFIWFRGHAVRFFFFFEELFLETFPLFLADFQSSMISVLAFFFGEFFATNFGLGVRGIRFWGGFLGPEMPLFCFPKTAKKKVLPVLAFFFRSSIFVTARFPEGFWDTSSVSYDGAVFAWFWVCVFV